MWRLDLPITERQGHILVEQDGIAFFSGQDMDGKKGLGLGNDQARE